MATVQGGTRSSEVVAESPALLGFESAQSRPPADLAVEFVDFPFTDESASYADHLAVVEREQPRIAVAPDVEAGRDPATVYEQADELAESADVVVVVPKAIHPTDVPDRFRVGVPLANFGSDAPHAWPEYRDAGDLHLLGGSPTLQLEAGRYLPNVASVDGAAIFKGAEMGNLWAPNTGRGRNWHPTGKYQFRYYERVAASLRNITRAWANQRGYPAPVDGEMEVPPEPDRLDEAADRAARDVVAARDEQIAARGEDLDALTDEERRYREARGPPLLDEADADLWSRYDTAPGEAWDFAEEMAEAEQQALDDLTDDMDQAGLDEWADADLAALDQDVEVAADGGAEPPTMYWVKGPQGPQDWLDGEDVLISAGAAWRNSGSGFNTDVPDADRLFVDSGGYQAAVHFRDAYPYSARDLFEWAEEIGADYVAGMDWACEDPAALAGLFDDVEPDDIAPVDVRLERTIRDQRECLDVYQSREWSFEFVPVVQGNEIDQYRWCARKLRQHDLARPYMGIGTVCKRETADGILDVLDAVEEELPATAWHLFGATKEVWTDRRFWGRFRSADTHAWAMKTPEGEWTANNADKRRAFDAYQSDIEAVRDQIAGQSTFSSSNASRALATSLRAVGARECVCGTIIPAYRTDFEPGCRHCEMTALNRWTAAQAEAENKAMEMADRDDDEQQATLGADSEGNGNMSDRDTYDPTTEWSDDRPRNETLVDDDARADREPEIDQGGSDEFADDRATTDADLDEPDAGSQASLVEEAVDDEGGQMDLTGSQATTGAEWDDGDPDDDGELFDGEERGRIKHHAISNDLDLLLMSPKQAGDSWQIEDFHAVGIETTDEFVRRGLTGDFTDVDGVGEATSERLEEAAAIANERLDLVVDDADQADGLLDEMRERVERFKTERQRPMPDDEVEGTIYQGIDRREIPDSGLSLSDITDWTYINDERENPEERETFQNFMADVYGSATPDADPDPLYAVVHADHGPARYIEGFGADEAAAKAHAEEMGDDYEVRYDSGQAAHQDTEADDAEDLPGAESVTEQTVAEGMVDAPEPWQHVADHEDAEKAESILLTHPDGYLAEIWQRADDVHQQSDLDLTAEQAGAGKWDVEYVDPNGTRRDGSDGFHDDPQEAMDQLAPFIKQRRADRRNRAEQTAEMERVEWPEKIGRFRLKPNHSEDHAEYHTSYLRTVTVLGRQHGQDSLKINHYQDTGHYHIRDGFGTDGGEFDRKAPAIEQAREYLEDRSEELADIEASVREEHDLDGGEGDGSAEDSDGDSGHSRGDTDGLLKDGFKKTKLIDLPGIGEKTAAKVQTTTVAGAAGYYRPSYPSPHPEIDQEQRQTIAREFTDDQQATLFEAIEQYADREDIDVDVEATVDEFNAAAWTEDDDASSSSPDGDDDPEPAEFAYQIDGDGDVWKAATMGLGMLRRNWQDARHDADGYDQDDVSELIGEINGRASDDLDVTQTEMDMLWHGSAELADADQKVANRLDRALASAEDDDERPHVDLPTSLAEAVERSTDTDGWQAHEWSAVDDTLYFGEYARRGSSEKVVIEPVGTGYSVTLVDVDDDLTRTLDGQTQQPVEATVEGLNDHYGTTEEPAVEERAGPEIAFGRRDDANDWRDANPDLLHPKDNRSRKTVELHPDVDDDLRQQAEQDALATRSEETKTYEQKTLTDAERETLDARDGWTWNRNGLEAMNVKGALLAEGSTEWLDHYEAGEGIDGSLANFENAKERGGATGTARVDSEKSEGEMARAMQKAEAQEENRAEEACENGIMGACNDLQERFGWTDEELERLLAAAETVQEDPREIYQPTADVADVDDTGGVDVEVPDLPEAVGSAFDEWADTFDVAVEEPTTEEIAPVAPTPTEEPARAEADLSGPALRALKKAWSGYKLARQEQREAVDRQQHYAEVINGIRAVNGQDPLTFEDLDGFDGGDPVPSDPTEEFPTADGGTATLEEAAEAGTLAGKVQATLSGFKSDDGIDADPYDPTGEF